MDGQTDRQTDRRTDRRTDRQTDRRKRGRDEAEAAATIKQKPGIFERRRQNLLRRCRLRIEVGGRTFEHRLKIGTKYTFFFLQNTSVFLLDFQP